MAVGLVWWVVLCTGTVCEADAGRRTRGVFESFVAQSAANHVSLCERNRVVLHPSVKVVTKAVCVKLLVRIIHTTK